MRRRRYALVTALVLLVAACGGGKKVVGGGPGSTTPATGAATSACKSTTLRATEVGVTPTEITVTVVADTGSVLRPGLFQGSVDAVKAWADYWNSKGGLACRRINVKSADSRLTADDAKNAITTACGDSLALVGTTALFVNDMAPAEQCKDKAGNATGLPDLAELQTEPAQQCSAISFAVLPTGSSCPYTSGVRTFAIATTPWDYYFGKYGKDTLHGVWVIPADLPSTISASMPGFRASQRLGIKLDREFGASGLSPQSAYTPFAVEMKNRGSTYGRVGLDYKGNVYLRKEAAAQGVNTVKVWDCSLQCYDQRLLSEGGAAVEDQYVWISFLPFEDRGANKELDSFLQWDKKPDGFGAQAWIAAELFAKTVNDVVAKRGPNGLTRTALLEAIRNTHDFDAGGMIPKTDIGNRKGSACIVMLQVKNNKFVRVASTRPGTFDCDGREYDISLDPVAEYHG